MKIKVCEGSAGCCMMSDARLAVQTRDGASSPQATDAYYESGLAWTASERSRLGNPILLAQATSNEGIKIVPGSRENNEDGSWFAELAADQVVKGVRCAKGTTFIFTRAASWGVHILR